MLNDLRVRFPWAYSAIGRGPWHLGWEPVGIISAAEAVVASPRAPTVSYSRWSVSTEQVGEKASLISSRPSWLPLSLESRSETENEPSLAGGLLRSCPRAAGSGWSGDTPSVLPP